MDELLTFALLRASLRLSQEAFIENLSQGNKKKETCFGQPWKNALTGHSRILGCGVHFQE
jgi:hypothetical protein